MLNQELELSLNMAFARAREHRHEFMTVEHLLLALLSNPSAREALEACSVDLVALRLWLSPERASTVMSL